MKYLFLLIFIASCATPIRVPYNYTDTMLRGLQEEFLLEAEKRHVPVATNVVFIGFADIQLVDTEEETVRLGVCIEDIEQYYDKPLHRTTLIYKMVLLDNSLMLPDNYPALKYFINHEFGHCYLNLEHSDDPTDLMYPVAKKVIYTPEEWQDLLNRAFYRSLTSP